MTSIKDSQRKMNCQVYKPKIIQLKLVKTYNTFRETAEEEEMRYFIKGRDFVIDLCGMIDILSPFMEMMIRVQAMVQLI